MLKNEKEDKEYDEYYIAYTLMIECLNTEDIYEGIRNTLNILCGYIKADCAQLLKLEENDKYHVFNNSCTPSKIRKLEDVINGIGKVPNRKYMELELEDELIQKLVMIPIEFDNSNYLIVTVNDNISTVKNSRKVYELIKQSFFVILKKLEDYLKIKKISEEDVLTGFGNRHAYSKKIEELEKEDNNNIVYTLIDIFRLKYVNDNYGHKTGDLYIKKSAEILEKYFPKYYMSETLAPTGDSIYRIGGDEFAIISTKKDKEIVTDLLRLAREEIKMLDLNVEEQLPLSINYGVAERNNNEKIDNLYQEADQQMSSDKAKMYVKLGIKRRK